MPEHGVLAGDDLGPLARLLVLKRTPVLRAVTDDVAMALAESARERFIPAGQELLRENEPSGALHFVASGEVSLRWHGTPLGSVGAWAPLVGLHAFLQREPGLAATAVRDTLTLEIGAEAFAEILEEHFDLAHVLLRHLAGDLVDLSQRFGCAPATAAAHESQVANSQRAPDPGLDLVERMLLLKGLGVFSRAALTTLAQLGRGLQDSAVPSGTELWTPGQAADTFLLILRGRVVCEIEGDGEGFEQGPGAALGLIEGLAARPRRGRARALEPLRALRGRVEAVIDALEDDSEAAFQVMAILARDTLALVSASGEGPAALASLLGCRAAAGGTRT